MTTTNQTSQANAAGQATKAVQPNAPEIPWDDVIGGNTDFEVQYPRMQWQHGQAAASGFMKTGGLFISKEEYPDFTGEGFEPSVLITDEGTEIQGYAASQAKLAVIRIKHQWVKDETYHKNVPLAHVLVVVKGCDDLINISLKGPTKSLEFQKAFNQHIAQNVSVANRTRPVNANPIEPLALWFPVRAAASRKASSKSGDTSSPVTPPELIAPETIDRNYVASLWVGSDKYREFVGFFRETEQWQKSPIWEKREERNEIVYSGENPDRNEFVNATQQQLELLIQGCTAKNLDVKELALIITGGATDRIENLSKAEASLAIEQMKAA